MLCLILLICLIIITNLQAFRTSLTISKVINQKNHHQKLFLTPEDLDQIQQLLQPLHRDVADLKIAVEDLKNAVEDLQNNAAHVTESYIRQEEYKKMQSASKPAIIRSLSDLASFVIEQTHEQAYLHPRTLTSAMENLNYSKYQLINKATKKLVNHIYHNYESVMDALVNHLNIRREFAEAICSEPLKEDSLPSDHRTDFENTIAQFAMSNKGDRYMMISDSVFGLILFSCCCDCIPIHELEFDMQPQIRKLSVKKEFMITIYEIKRSRGLVSIRQRLKILENALIAIYKATRVELEGVLLLSSRWNREEFAATLPPDSDFDFRIEYR